MQTVRREDHVLLLWALAHGVPLHESLTFYLCLHRATAHPPGFGPKSTGLQTSLPGPSHQAGAFQLWARAAAWPSPTAAFPS